MIKCDVCLKNIPSPSADYLKRESNIDSATNIIDICTNCYHKIAEKYKLLCKNLNKQAWTQAAVDEKNKYIHESKLGTDVNIRDVF